MTEATGAGNSPIAVALGDDFAELHPAVRRHYAEPSIDIGGTMDVVEVNRVVRPLALMSYRLFGAPVPHSGRNVGFRVRNRTDDAGTMHWVRTFFEGGGFPETVTFASRMVCSGDHRVIEFTRYGVGVEANVSVDAEGSLVYDFRRWVVRVPFLGLTLRLPSWLWPFGAGPTKETGESGDSFRVEFEMSHLLFGRTLSYTGVCRFDST